MTLFSPFGRSKADSPPFLPLEILRQRTKKESINQAYLQILSLIIEDGLSRLTPVFHFQLSISGMLWFFRIVCNYNIQPPRIRTQVGEGHEPNPCISVPVHVLHAAMSMDILLSSLRTIRCGSSPIPGILWLASSSTTRIYTPIAIHL